MTEADDAEEGCITEEEDGLAMQETLQCQSIPPQNQSAPSAFGASASVPSTSASSLPYETGASTHSGRQASRRAPTASSTIRGASHRQHHGPPRHQGRHTANSTTTSDSEVEVVPSTDVFSQLTSNKTMSHPAADRTSPSRQTQSSCLGQSYQNDVYAHSIPQDRANSLIASQSGSVVRLEPSMTSGLIQPLAPPMHMWMPPTQSINTQPMMVFVPTLQGDGSMTLVPTWTSPTAVSSPLSALPAPTPIYRQQEVRETTSSSIHSTSQTMHTQHQSIVQANSHPSFPRDPFSPPVPPDALVATRVPPPPPPPPPLIDPYAMTASSGATSISSRGMAKALTQNMHHHHNAYAPASSAFGNRGAHYSAPYTQSRSHAPSRSAYTRVSWNSSADTKPQAGQEWSAPSVLRANQEQSVRPPPPPTTQQSSARQNWSNEFHCAVCDRDFRHKSRYDLHLIEDHVPCDQCEWTGPPAMLLAHNLNHVRGKDGEVICKSKIEEETWLAARRKKREIKRQGGDPRKVKVPMSELEAALRESLRVRRIYKMRLSANLLKRQPRDSGVLPQAHAYARMFQAKRTETFEGPEIAKTDQCRIWQEFNICHSYLRHRTCKFGKACSRSHDIKRYQDWQLNRIKSGIQVKFRHYNAKALLYTLAAPEIAKYERTLLKCFKVLIQNNFWLGDSSHVKTSTSPEKSGSIGTDASDSGSSTSSQEDVTDDTTSDLAVASSPSCQDLSSDTHVRQSEIIPVIPVRQGSCGSPMSSSPLVAGKPMAPGA